MRPAKQPQRQATATFNGENQAILNMVQRTPEADRLCTILLVNHGATDLLEILDLT